MMTDLFKDSPAYHWLTDHAREEGIVLGRELGHEEGLVRGREQGLEQGRENGLRGPF